MHMILASHCLSGTVFNMDASSLCSIASKESHTYLVHFNQILSPPSSKGADLIIVL